MNTLPFVHVLKSEFPIGQLNFKERGLFFSSIFSVFVSVCEPRMESEIDAVTLSFSKSFFTEIEKKKISDSFELRNLPEIDLFVVL